MSKRKCCINKGLFWLFLLPLLWFALSMWWYTCKIQQKCSVSPMTTKEQVEEKTSEQKESIQTIEEKEEVKTEEILTTGNNNTGTSTVAVTKDVTETCTGILNKYIRLGSSNDSQEVKNLEKFLNEYEGENLAIDGVYSVEDENAVKRFQLKYNNDILSDSTMWEDIDQKPTGYVYITTKKKINEIYCSKQN